MRRVVTAVAVVLCACGAPIESICEAFVTSTCDAQKACGVAASDAPCADVTTNSRMSSTPCDGALLEAVKTGAVRYDGVAAQKCLETLGTQCRAVGACDGVFTGTVALGGACTVTEACGDDAWCDDSATCPGVCTARVGHGENVGNVEACNTGGFEFFSDGGIRCKQSGELGAACSYQTDCGRDLACDLGTCVRAPSEGEPCIGQKCASGLRCDSTHCRAWAHVGEACGNEFTMGGQCQLGLACRDGVCGDALREGERCANNPNRCGAGLDCNNDSCVKRGVDGASCQSLFDCDVGFFCDADTCRAQQPEGGACTTRQGCQLNLACEAGACRVPQCTP